jgi:hypothetical protein
VETSLCRNLFVLVMIEDFLRWTRTKKIDSCVWRGVEYHGLNLGFSYGDASHDIWNNIHVFFLILLHPSSVFYQSTELEWYLDSRLLLVRKEIRSILGTSLNWFYFVCGNLFLSIKLCSTWSVENSSNSKSIYKNHAKKNYNLSVGICRE